MSFVPPVEFGPFIKHFLKSKNVSKSYVQKKTGLERKTLDRWEKGSVQRIHDSTLEAFAECFGLTVDELLEDFEAYKKSIASDTDQATHSPPDTDQTVTATASDTTEAIASSPNEWKPKNKVLLCFFVINAVFGVAVYIFAPEKVAAYIIDSAVGVIAACDIALVILLNSYATKQRLKKWLKLPEDANSKVIVYRAAVINVSFLMFVILTPILTPWILSFKSITISGEASCIDNEPIEGIWVNAVSGGSGWADKHKTNSIGSEVGFTYVLPNSGTYNLHVGCGGSEQHWNNVDTTENGSGTVQDHTFHFFICQDVPRVAGHGACHLKH